MSTEYYIGTRKNFATGVDFIAGVERLKMEKLLLIDPIGENVFFRVTDGRLSIKLVDYGCFELKWQDDDEEAEVNKNRRATLNYIEKLKMMAG